MCLFWCLNVIVRLGVCTDWYANHSGSGVGTWRLPILLSVSAAHHLQNTNMAVQSHYQDVSTVRATFQCINQNDKFFTENLETVANIIQ